MCKIVKVVDLPEIISEPVHMTEITLFDIAEAVAKATNRKVSDLFMDSAKEEYVNIRRIFFYYVKENTHLTYREIGAFLKKDRGTVRHHYEKMASWMEIKDYRNRYMPIMQQINNLL